jgi:voltage-gated potassium channel
MKSLASESMWKRRSVSARPVAFTASMPVVATGLLLALIAGGTFGYVAIEGMSAFDALYMTVTTITTVGFREVQPLSAAGRWFTMGLIVFGVGAALYTFSAFAGFVIEGKLRTVLGRRNMQRAIDALEGHVILCGFGRLGRAVSQRLAGTPVVVIDVDAGIQGDCESAGHWFVHGSALEENVLRAAGIERARALIAATASDPDNVFIALSACDLRPEIQIHARAETAAGIRRLELAGVHQVVSPHQLGGERIANALLRPGVVEFLELSNPGTGAEVDLEEVVLSSRCQVEGIPLRALRDHGVRVSVVAIKRGTEPIRLGPGPDELLRGGDRVIAVGDRPNLARLAELALPA